MFPDYSSISQYYSDFGEISKETAANWDQQQAVRLKYKKYYTGRVFEENSMNSSIGETEEFPIGINISQMICLAMTDSLFGEWSESIIDFEPNKSSEISKDQVEASDIIRKIMNASNANTMLWEVVLDTNIYGGAAIKVSAALGTPAGVVISRIPLEYFYPIFDPDDSDKLIEVYVSIPMSKDQARIKYGVKSEKDIVYRVEHWTNRIYENRVDGVRIDQYSGINPFGFVPFVYIPRYRSTHLWGDSAIESIMRVQDELNARVADLGEGINYNSHPIKYGLNLSRGFNPTNYPVDPDAFWDLGKTIGDNPPPQVGILEAKNPIPSGTFDYISFLYDWSRTSSSAPPIAFGEDSGGGQRSGITLEIRMWPLIKAVRRSRAYLGVGIMSAVKMGARIIKTKNLPGVSKRALDAILNDEMGPAFANIMPMDRAAIVDEFVKEMSTTPPGVSLVTAQKKLGHGAGEVELIKAMLKDEDLYVRSKGTMDKENAEAKANATPGTDGRAGRSGDPKETEKKKQESINGPE